MLYNVGMIKFKKMTYEEWKINFKPIREEIFETYGVEFEHVCTVDPRCIWTLVSNEGEGILSGYHTVNRIGYYITEFPFEEDENIIGYVNMS